MTKTEAIEREAILAQYPTYISPGVAAKIVNVHPKTLSRLSARGDLRMYRIGRARTTRYRTEDILDLVVRVA